MLLGLDLGAELTGYCVGIGDSIPTAGAWRFSPAGDDLGALGDALYRALDGLTTLYPVTRIVYEAPILLRRDKLLTLRKLYGLGMVLETWAKQVAVPCHEASVAALKRELAGRAHAEKADMVFAAEKMGVQLPDALAHGRYDAADAVAAWLIGVRCYARQHQARWDQVLYGSRGALV